jgi:2-oxo-4-hydroxy-4-carboxy-5-ureidoimidazoline decarboxylase
MVRADEAGQEHEAARVDHLVGLRRQLRCWANRFHDVVAQQHGTVGNLPAGVVERRDERRVTEKQRANRTGPAMTSIAALNAADRATFVAAIGLAFEHSPWIAKAAWPRRPFADLDDLHTTLIDVVASASAERQIALIAAHPDLAGRVAREGRLTAASRGEQAAAGLGRLTPAEIARFDGANAAYRARFGFPFVICAREHDQASILAALERRVRNDRAAEIATALGEIAKIARLRLEDSVTA